MVIIMYTDVLHTKNQSVYFAVIIYCLKKQYGNTEKKKSKSPNSLYLLPFHKTIWSSLS